MDGINICDLGRTNDSRDIQVALRRARWANADGFVGKSNRKGIAIGLTVDRNCADAEFLTGADNAKRNFSAIGNEDFIKHSLELHRGRMLNSPCAYSTGWPLLTRRLTISPLTSASISFISFMASMMHSTWPASTVSPAFTNGGDPGDGDS